MNRLRIGHIRLTRGQVFVGKKEKPKRDSCGTAEPSDNHTITECIQNAADELNSTRHTKLEPDVDTTTQNLKFLSIINLISTQIDTNAVRFVLYII
ncbi:unnamed protein product [Macrosiphum euphorbiae]|uniref:Uncharacterized protein n=1 Tax=Macrosiphum euphorbiae TaxID=13131 RepID=A0AAV0XK72_9HEMI|nr:unnamed protein product [Macrosiphum euphorbiae]